MIRAIKRNIARNLLKDMKYDKVNKRLGYRNGMKGGRVTNVQIRNGMKTPSSRERLNKFLTEHPAVWQRVLYGDLKERAQKSFMAASRRRKVEACYR